MLKVSRIWTFNSCDNSFILEKLINNIFSNEHTLPYTERIR